MPLGRTSSSPRLRAPGATPSGNEGHTIQLSQAMVTVGRNAFLRPSSSPRRPQNLLLQRRAPDPLPLCLKQGPVARGIHRAQPRRQSTYHTSDSKRQLSSLHPHTLRRASKILKTITSPASIRRMSVHRVTSQRKNVASLRRGTPISVDDAFSSSVLQVAQGDLNSTPKNTLHVLG